MINRPIGYLKNRPRNRCTDLFFFNVIHLNIKPPEYHIILVLFLKTKVAILNLIKLSLVVSNKYVTNIFPLAFQLG